jgi:hypothetical protein
MKHELQNVISGKSQVRFGGIIQAAAGYLKRSQSSGSVAKGTKLFKKQETEALTGYIVRNSLFISDIVLNFLSEGAEQKVFLLDGKNVVKFNNSIFYNAWEDYFHSLLLHNFFFPDTAYELLGFKKEQDHLQAIVKTALH